MQLMMLNLTAPLLNLYYNCSGNKTSSPVHKTFKDVLNTTVFEWKIKEIKMGSEIEG